MSGRNVLALTAIATSLAPCVPSSGTTQEREGGRNGTDYVAVGRAGTVACTWDGGAYWTVGVEVSNVGPATLPPEAWDDEAVAVVLHGDEEPWERVALVSFDPERGLEPPGGGRSVTLGAEPVSDSA